MAEPFGVEAARQAATTKFDELSYLYKDDSDTSVERDDEETGTEGDRIFMVLVYDVGNDDPRDVHTFDSSDYKEDSK